MEKKAFLFFVKKKAKYERAILGNIVLRMVR